MRLGLIASPGTPPPSTDHLTWMIKETAKLGLSTVNSGIQHWKDPKYVEGLRRLLAEEEIEIIPCVGGNYVEMGDVAVETRLRLTEELSLCKAVGAKIVWTCCYSRDHNRFTNHPPVKEQIVQIAENLKFISQEAEALGLVMALENHLDYRGYEIAEIIERVGSPSLGASLDTGNPFTVFEEPVEAAKVLAPYTYTVHFKDYRVVPWDNDESGQERTLVACAPLGGGHVDLVTIVDILSKNAPDPKNLPLNIELSFVPQGIDTRKLVLESIDYARRTFPQHLVARPERHQA